MRACIYVLCPTQHEYDRACLEYTKPWEKPIIIPQTYWLEGVMYASELMNRYDEWKDLDYVGCISHSAHTKQPKIHDIDHLMKEGLSRESHVVAFMGRRVIDIVMNGEMYHPGFRKAWCAVWEHLGYDPDDMSLPCFAFFCNYWCSTPTFMVSYCNLIARLDTCLRETPGLKQALWRDSKYGDAKIDRDRLRLLFGVPYYPLLPFVVERMICAFTKKEECRVSYIS